MTTLSHPHRLGTPLPERIVIVRALAGLGDLLCAVPSLRTLREALPGAHIALCGLPSAGPFVERFRRYVDELVAFPGFPGIAEREPRVAELPAFLASIHARRFDLALQLHGSGIVSNPFTMLLGARHAAGCYLPGQYCPDPERFLPYPTGEPEIWRNLRLLEFLGVPLHGDELEFPLTEAEEEQGRAVARAHGLEPGNYAVVHPGAAAPSRRWPPERFAAVADLLAARGPRVALTGTAAEADLTAAVAAAMRAPSVNLTGRTDLGALAALVRRARLLVCNDTGVSHLAAAMGTPSVVIFSASDPRRWAPLDRDRHRAVVPPSAAEGAGCGCSVEARCLRDGCLALPRFPDARVDPVATGRVLAEVESMLDGEAAG